VLAAQVQQAAARLVLRRLLVQHFGRHLVWYWLAQPQVVLAGPIQEQQGLRSPPTFFQQQPAGRVVAAAPQP
jgi:hypothetical protein